jgi:hypothetical protein
MKVSIELKLIVKTFKFKIGMLWANIAQHQEISGELYL